MARGRRVFQRQYEKGGERERKLTLNLLLPHLSVNFTLVPFFVQTFHCDSIDCPLLLHKRRQSRLHMWAAYKCSSKFQSYSCFLKLKTFQVEACLHGAVTKKKKVHTKVYRGSISYEISSPFFIPDSRGVALQE